ncbi:MAG: DUF357 domain-containing protein [Promethearchaeia archaeon]
MTITGFEDSKKEKNTDQVIEKEKVLKYLKTTEKALNEIKYSSMMGTKLYDIAKDYDNMAQSYFEDAKFYMEKNDLVTAFGALNYAHGFLDAGVRLGVFEIEQDQIFAFYNEKNSK